MAERGFTFTLVVVLAWMGSNISVVLLNRMLLTGNKFKFPLFLTGTHMVSSVMFSFLATWFKIIPPISRIRSVRQGSKIAALSVLFCYTVAVNNMSLRYIPVSFNQALGATTPFFTAILAFLIARQVETCRVYGALVPVVAGIVVASNAEPSFHLFGFLCAMTSTASRAAKTVVQGLLLAAQDEKMDPLSLLFYMALFSTALLIPATLLWEPAAAGVTLALLGEGRGGLLSSPFGWWLAANCGLAFAQNLLNFWVTKLTSPLTLQVLGQGKGVAAAIISVLLFKNKVTFTGWAGYMTTVAGVLWYGEEKRRSKQAASGASGGGEGSAPGDRALTALSDAVAGGGGMRERSGVVAPGVGGRAGGGGSAELQKPLLEGHGQGQSAA